MAPTAEDTPHYQISLFCNHESYRQLSDYTISVPTKVTVENLNALANQALKEVSEDEVKDVVFDFLICSTILRSTLEEFVQENQVPIESVIRIECIVQEPAPAPFLDLSLPDWVGTIHASENFILVGTYDGETSLWKQSGLKLASSLIHKEAVKCCTRLPNTSGIRIATAGNDQTVMISEVEGYECEASIRLTHVLRGHERSVECIAANSDGTRLVSGGFDNMLKIWNTETDDISTIFTGKISKDFKKRMKMDVVPKTPMVTLQGHKDAIVGAVWSPLSNKEVITVSWDHCLAVWDLELAGQTNSMHSRQAFTSVSACPTNSLVITGSTDSIVRLWDPRSHEGSLVKQAFTGHRGWVSSVCWNRTRENLFITASFDRTTKMWDIRSNKTPLYEMLGHSDRILCCEWSVDQMILSGGVDCTVKAYRRNQ